MTHTSPSPSVLLVDDEAGIRIALEAQFFGRGWHVELASGVSEARQHLARTRFDLVISDVRMQDGDGFDVLQAAQLGSPQPAFLFLTAYGSVPDAVRAMQGGAVDYLTKPATFDHLQAAVSRVLLERSSAPTHAPAHKTTGIIGNSRSLQLALARARAAAAPPPPPPSLRGQFASRSPSSPSVCWR